MGESQVESLLQAERHALGVGPLQLFLAEMRTCLVQAVPAVTRGGYLPGIARPVLKGLRGAVQRGCPVPVARIAGQEGQAEEGAGHIPVVAVPAADPQGGLEGGPGAVEVCLGAQHKTQVRPDAGVLPSDLLRGLRGGFQVGPGGREVTGVYGSSAGVAVQHGVEEMLAGSFGAGDCLGVQRPGPGRVDGHEIREQALGYQQVVAEPPGQLDSFLPGRTRYVRLAGEDLRAAQCRQGLAEQPVVAELAGDLDRLAKKAGISITLSSSNFGYMITNYIDPAAPANENKWAMMDFGGETLAPYPTTFGLFNTGGSTQIGDYSNSTADSLINDSITDGNPTAVKNEASFLTMDQPVMFQPNADNIWAWKTSISATEPGYLENLTQFYATPEFWYTTK